MNEQEEREMCPRKWVGKPLPDDCPELQKKAKKSRGMGKMRKVAEVKQSNSQSEGRRSREGKVVTARAREQKDP